MPITYFVTVCKTYKDIEVKTQGKRKKGKVKKMTSALNFINPEDEELLKVKIIVHHASDNQNHTEMSCTVVSCLYLWCKTFFPGSVKTHLIVGFFLQQLAIVAWSFEQLQNSCNVVATKHSKILWKLDFKNVLSFY